GRVDAEHRVQARAEGISVDDDDLATELREVHAEIHGEERLAYAASPAADDDDPSRAPPGATLERLRKRLRRKRIGHGPTLVQSRSSTKFALQRADDVRPEQRVACYGGVVPSPPINRSCTLAKRSCTPSRGTSCTRRRPPCRCTRCS